MAAIEQNPHALALLAALDLDSHGIAVGDGAAPTEHDGRYLVLHMLPGGEIDGTAADPDEWIDGRFQLTAVGRNASESRWVADRANAAIAVPAAVTVAGRSIQRVRPLEGWGGVQRGDDLVPPLFYTTRVYGLFSFDT